MCLKLGPSWTGDVTEMDKRVADTGKDRAVALCRGLRRQLQTDGVYYEDVSLALEQVRHVWPPIPPLYTLENGGNDDYLLDEQLSSIQEDDIDSEQAASTATMGRVAGARSDETQTEFGAEAERQPRQRDEEGKPRRRARTLLDMWKCRRSRTKRPSFAFT